MPTPQVMPDAAAMGSRLRALRERLGFTPSQAADALGLAVGNYRHLEAGRNRLLAAHIPRLAAAFGIQADIVA